MLDYFEDLWEIILGSTSFLGHQLISARLVMLIFLSNKNFTCLTWFFIKGKISMLIFLVLQLFLSI